MRLSLFLLLICSTGLAAPTRKIYKADLPVDDILYVKNEYQAFEPIVIGCSCDPQPGTELRLFWQFSDGAKAIPVGKEQHVWAPEGEHWIELTVVQQSYTELLVFVPDEKNPNDLTKAKAQKIKIAGELTINRYKKGFRVGKAPIPPPTPDPTPAGPRSVLLLHESGSMTPQFANTIKLLHNKIDSFFPLDIDSKGADNKPSPVISSWLKYLPNPPTLPALIVVDQRTKAVIYAKEISASLTADEIVALSEVK